MRILAAVMGASGVPGIIVYFALASQSDSTLIGALLLSPIFLPAAIAFGALQSLLPTAALGIFLTSVSVFWGWARYKVAWAITGLVAGFFLVSEISAAANPFADLAGACTAAIAGASSMLTFCLIVRPDRFPKPLMPVKNVLSAGLLFVIVILASASIGTAYMRRDTFAVPDTSKFRLAVPVGNPDAVTLFSYLGSEEGQNGSTWKTNGHSITLKTGLPGSSPGQIVVNWATIRFAPQEVFQLGADPSNFSPGRVPDLSETDIGIMVAVDQSDEQTKIIRSSRDLATQPLSQGDQRATDPNCAIVWHWRDHKTETVSPLETSDTYRKAVGAALTSTPSEATRFNCTGDICMITFPYRNVIASFWIKPEAACQWKQQRAAIIRGLDSRLVSVTPAKL